MLELNATTKRAEYFIYSYLRAKQISKTTLQDYYNRPSVAKLQAFQELKNKFYRLWNRDNIPADYYPIVTGASCHQFTVMYIAPHPESHFYCLFVETLKNTYYINVEDSNKLYLFTHKED